jgi:hypothetical protein
MATVKSVTLINKIDAFAKQLLDRACTVKVPAANGDASVGSGPPPAEVPLADQVAVFTAVQRWVQIKAKIDPDDDAGDFISAARNALRDGAAPGRRRSHRRKNEPPEIEIGDDGDGELDPVL